MGYLVAEIRCRPDERVEKVRTAGLIQNKACRFNQNLAATHNCGVTFGDPVIFLFLMMRVDALLPVFIFFV